VPTGVIRHTQKEVQEVTKKCLLHFITFFIFYPDTILFRQIENEKTFYAIRVKPAGRWRECIITCGEKMQRQNFKLIYTTYSNLCLSDKISKINESDTVRTGHHCHGPEGTKRS